MSIFACIDGDSHQYQVHPQLKVYALQDVGFTKSKQGNFTWEYPLSGASPYVATYNLKVKIKSDLKSLSLSVTDQSGLHKVNLFKLADNQELLSQYQYVMDDLVQRAILQRVES
ncbi:DUF1831 domain-containing protein [Bombilactobacillus folatiphilus]|uniref:DUF1831 domain-containing protein n=1 Tax=Bombilactobacillus folatiphilus TaxID=2923362 RepID=A0ABY4PAL9_9LACO|nr:DUF1831 domain-containing protein [Bombilactobacillus folatiphilus]UQS82718.1 DUF1831 domain-containing protein [Bombilactobacillus folatiphilus]